MMMVVLDTNVVVSGMITPRGVCGQILAEMAEARFRVCASEAMLLEYKDVLNRSYLKISLVAAVTFFTLIERIGLKVTGTGAKFGLPDPDDEEFLDVALVVGADYLVTGNLKHFPSKLTKGMRVVPPAEFLRIFKG